MNYRLSGTCPNKKLWLEERSLDTDIFGRMGKSV
jgi:hypothetical protein